MDRVVGIGKKEKLSYTDREIGSTNSRTVIFEVATGKKKIVTQPLII